MMTPALPKIAPLCSNRGPTLKYDGFRALLEIDAAGARLSRNRNLFRHLDPMAKRLSVTDALLDGEVICPDDTGRPIFLDLLRRRKPAAFVAFDLLWLDGEDMRALPLVERKKRLRRLLRRRPNPFIVEAIAIDGRGKELMAAVTAHARTRGRRLRKAREPVIPRTMALAGVMRGTAVAVSARYFVILFAAIGGTDEFVLTSSVSGRRDLSGRREERSPHSIDPEIGRPVATVRDAAQHYFDIPHLSDENGCQNGCRCSSRRVLPVRIALDRSRLTQLRPPPGLFLS
jgi:hypothetical protein